MNSESVLADTTSLFTKWLTKRLNCSILFLFSYANLYGILVRNLNVIIFQVLNLKGKHFLDLLNNNNIIEPLYIKDKLWLKYFGYFNSLCVKTTRAITNYAFIGEYRLKFFFKKNFTCLCKLYPIKSWKHILYEYRRFNKYWNLKKNLISHFILFLEFNPNIFAFANSIT